MEERGGLVKTSSMGGPGWSVDFRDELPDHLRIGLALDHAPEERSIVVTVRATDVHGEDAQATTGLHWSDALSSSFSYFPATGEPVWRSGLVTFPAPVGRVEVQVLFWPARHDAAHTVRRLFLETTSELRQPPSRTVHIPQRSTHA